MKNLFLFVFFPAVLCASCAGIEAEISIRGNGSGTLKLEYRVSELADSLGRLDGNERWQTVPSGRADFERGVSRIPGLRLKSFSTKKIAPNKDAKNSGGAADSAGYRIDRAEIEFKNIEALAAFLDASGSRARYTQENGKNRLSLTLSGVSDGGAALDPDLLRLVREASAGYRITIALSAPGGASLEMTPDAAQASTVRAGKKVSLSIGTEELLSLDKGLTAEFVW